MSKTDNRLLKWFQLASLAPSAANIQPWSYQGDRIGQDYQVTIKIHQTFLAEPPTLDPYFATATIAIGCFVQNLEIAANLDGFKCVSSDVFGEAAANWQWKLVFILTAPSEIILFCTEETLHKRVSNRTLYERSPVEAADLLGAQNLVLKDPDVTFTQISSLRNEWKRILIDLEAVRLKEDRLREELFHEFRTQSEIQDEPVGLPINTASNSLIQRCLLFLMKKIPFFQWPLKYGASSFFSWLSLSRPIFYSGDIFALQIKIPDPKAGVQLGKALEQLWLYWNHLGYSVQVIALPILIYGNREGLLGDRISRSGREILEKVKVQAQQKLNMDLTLMTILFRVGRARNSTPHSPRREVIL